MTINLNTNPYYDDFDETKNYVKILFKPSYAVQARELTQLQTALQKQISNMGSHFFKDGSIVLNGNTTVTKANFVDVTVTSTSVAPSIEGKVFVGQTNGANAKVITAKKTNTTTLRIYFVYTSGITFQRNELIVATDNSLSYTVNDVDEYAGSATTFSIIGSVFFVSGYFVYCNPQTIVLAENTETFNTTVGLQVTTSIQSSVEDPTLLDPSQGSFNFAAPGADRLAVDLSLVSYELTVPEDFIELSRFRDGEQIYKVTTATYSEIENTLARRTYDESGDYTVNAFIATAIDHVRNESDKLTISVGPGKAYVRGYEFETIASTYIDLPKAQEYDTKTNVSTQVPYGDYFVITTPNGSINYTANETVSVSINGGSAGTLVVTGIERETTDRYRLYVSSISIPRGFAISSITGFSTETWSAFVDTSYYTNGVFIVKSTNQSKLVPVGKKYIKTLLDDFGSSSTEFESITQFTNQAASANTVLVSAGAGQEFFSTIPNDYIVELSGELYQPDSVSITPTSATLSFSSIPNGIVSVIAPVVYSNILQKNKSLQETTINVSPSEEEISLGVSDCYELLSVVAVNTDTGDEYDITGMFDFNNGQTTETYEFGSVTLKQSETLPPFYDQLQITFSYFTHSSSIGFFSVDSYNLSEVPYENIQTFVSEENEEYKLTDYLDFRPIRQPDGSLQGAGIARPRSRISVDYSYYLSRIDKLILTKERKFDLIKGVAAENPSIPSDLPDAMSLYNVYLKPYTSSIRDVSTRYIDNRRYTMKDIGGIQKRVERVEYYTALSILEKQAVDEKLYDDLGVERFKNGILVDSFTGHSVGDVNSIEYLCSIDSLTRTLRPRFSSFSYGLEVTSLGAAERRGDLITLPVAATSVQVENPYATNWTNLNPYLVFQWNGVMNLSPATDNWVDTQTRPKVNVNINGENDVFTTIVPNVNNPASIGTKWNDWQTVVTGVTVDQSLETQTEKNTIVSEDGKEIDVETNTVSSSIKTSVDTTSFRTGIQIATSKVATITRDLGTKVVDVSISPFIRSRVIRFSASNLKPNTRLFASFDNTEVTEYCTPAFEMVLPTTYTIDESATEVRTQTGTKIADILIKKKNRLFFLMRQNNLSFDAGETVLFFSNGAQVGATTSVSSIEIRTNLVTNEIGDIAGTFLIPNNERIRFTNGEKMFRLADSLGINPTTAAETKYVALGLSQSTEQTVISTRVASVSINPTQQIGAARTETSNSSVTSSTDSVTDIRIPVPPTNIVASEDETTGDFSTGNTGRFEYNLNYDDAVTTSGSGVLGTSTINVISASGIKVGMRVSGSGISVISTVLSVSGNTVTISTPLTGNVTGSNNVTFTNTFSWIGIKYNKTNVPVRYTLIVNGVETTTGFVGHSGYNTILSNLGLPSVVGAGDGVLFVRRPAYTVTKATLIVEAPIASSGWSFRVPTPKESLPTAEVPLPVYSVAASRTTVNEGGTVTFTVTTQNVPDSQTLNWALVGTTNSSDFSSSSGALTLRNGRATVTVTLSEDATTEGPETFEFAVSLGAVVVATSTTIRVIDSSLAVSYAISSTTSASNEGGTLRFNIRTAGVPNGTVLYLTTTGTVSPNDFSVFPESVVIQNNAATVSITIADDFNTEGNEQFAVQLRTNSSSGNVVATSNTVSIADTSSEPSYSITARQTQINEGSSVTFDVTTQNVRDGTVVYWEVSGTTSSADFTDGATSGQITIRNNAATFTRNITSDATSEGVENFEVRLRLESISGAIVATSQTVYISDTSATPVATYAVSSNKTTVNEGETVIFNITTTNVANSTTLYWTINGIDADDFTPAASSVVVNNNLASVTLNITADALTEGNETFVFELRTGSGSGTIVATSSTITVFDTSGTPDPTYAVVPNRASVSEGNAVTFNVTTSSVSDGTTLYWTINGIDAADFTPAASSLTINGNSGSVTLNIAADLTTEGKETFVFELRTGSGSGTIVATSSTVTVFDTSIATPTYSLTADKTRIVEPDTVTFSVSTTNVADGTTLYWTTVGSSAADFSDNADSGSVVVQNGAATFTRSLVLNGTPNIELFHLSLRTVSISGAVVARSQSIVVRAPTPTYRVSVGENTSFDEGDQLAFSFYATGIPENTTFYYSIEGTTSVSDFGGSTTGTFQLSSGEFYNVIMTISSDRTTEGREEFVINMRSGSISGPILASSRSIVINDTSVNIPSYGAGINPTTINEGGITRAFIRVSNAAPSSSITVYPLVVPGGNATSADFVTTLLDPINIAVSSNGEGTANTPVTIVTDALAPEENETFRVEFHSNVERTQLLAATQTATIVNTTPIIPTTASAFVNVLSKQTYARDTSQRLTTPLTIVIEGYWIGTGAYRTARYRPQARPFLIGAAGEYTPPTPDGFIGSEQRVTGNIILTIGTLLDNGGTRNTISLDFVVDWIPEDPALPPLVTTTRIDLEPNRILDYLDPVAQSFYVDSRTNPDGIYVESIDLYFRTKSQAVPVTVQLRPNVNGYPSATTVLPFAIATKDAGLIQTSSDGSVATNFRFDNKVYLAPGEYSIVIIADTDEYEVFTSAIGEFDLVTNERVTTQPTLGSLYKSQNTFTWTAVQEEDLKFRLHKCIFGTTTAVVEYSTNLSTLDGSVPYELINVSGEMLDFARTNIDFEYMLPAGSWTNYQISSNVPLTSQRTLNSTSPFRFKTTLSTQNSDITPVVDLNRLQAIFVHNVVNNTSENETLPNVGLAESKYVTRTVKLAPGFEAADLMVFLYANTPPGASFEVYYRTKLFNDQLIEDNNWIQMQVRESGVGTSANFIEYKYVTPYTVNGVTRAVETGDRFESYAIKIVMKSSNPAFVPIIRDLRVLAIDD